ncbi:bifunctional tryptophan synthase trp1, partial [Rhizophlyctis rosea]
MTTLLIDNYDSFTWNVYQYLSELGAEVEVFRNDEVTLEQCIALNPRNVVISPGPGRPADAGVSNDVIRHFAGKVPILGVCLGEQCMYEVYGGTVTYAGEIVHGKTSPVKHDGRGVYEGVPQRIECTRYHSLAGDPATLPDVLEVTSWTDSGCVMGVRHKEFVMEGVQYHPESIASEYGK